MKILVIGQDPNLFNKDSESFNRIKDYAGLFEEFHVISATSKGLSHIRDGNLFLWPTNSGFQIFRIIDFMILGRRIIKSFDIGLIDAQDAGEAGFAAFYLSLLFKIPFRIQIHTDIFSPYFRRASWKEYIRYLTARFLIPKADCIRVVSERIKKSLSLNVKCKMSNVVVLPIFTDVSKFLNSKLNPDIEKIFSNYNFKMIAVGRFVDKEKNFSMLIEIMRDFVKTCPKALLVLVGDGPDGGNYKSQIANYKLQNNVIIEGWRDDLPSFYRSFDIFLLSSNYEGWGRVIIEAMASELPVIMTDVGLAGELVSDGVNGDIVPVGDRKAFIKRMKEFYNNKDMRLRMGKAGQDAVKNFGKGRDAYLEAYKKSLEKCKPRP